MMGCEFCQCRKNGGCPQENCTFTCPYGHQKDMDGCGMCMCQENPCNVRKLNTLGISVMFQSG